MILIFLLYCFGITISIIITVSRVLRDSTPISYIILYSPQFRSHQEIKMAARRTQRSTSCYDLTEKQGNVNNLFSVNLGAFEDSSILSVREASRLQTFPNSLFTPMTLCVHAKSKFN